MATKNTIVTLDSQSRKAYINSNSLLNFNLFRLAFTLKESVKDQNKQILVRLNTYISVQFSAILRMKRKQLIE